MSEVTVELTAAQELLWANTEWRAGYLAGLQRFVGADVVRATITAPDGSELGVYERAWQPV